MPIRFHDTKRCYSSSFSEWPSERRIASVGILGLLFWLVRLFWMVFLSVKAENNAVLAEAPYPPCGRRFAAMRPSDQRAAAVIRRLTRP